MKQILFYALKDDLAPILAAVETKLPITYTCMGAVSGVEPKAYATGSGLPDLGRASAGSAAASAAYLVSGAGQTVNVRAINLAGGGTRHVVDQLANPDSIVFSAGGVWSDDVLLYGRVGTASDSGESQALMKLFSSELRRKFRKVKAYWIGPGAYAWLESGKRLTISASSPAGFDLRLADAV